MAEAIVGFALAKLTNIMEKEIKFKGGVGKKVKWVQCELTQIQCYMRDADLKRKADVRVQKWLDELRDVAYRIEEATDTFFHEVDDHVKKNPSFLQNNPTLVQKLQKLCGLFENPQKVHILHKLGTELTDIQNILADISKKRVVYGIQNLQDIRGEAAVRLPIRRVTSQHADENEVVSMLAHKNNILKLLHANETPRLAVITIIGTGGLGKTTLARMVYKSASAEFDYHIMLSITQQFCLTDLLTKMLFQLKDSKLENSDKGDLIHELRSKLREKKYLIILDDVWHVNPWNQLKFAFPEGMNGSRVLMTSRFSDVVRLTQSKKAPYELGFLNDKESRELLLKMAFPYREPGEVWPSHLLEIADKLSKKCGRLPLALIVVGGILATKDPSYPAWERVLETLNWPSEGMNYMDILTMSYEDMPYFLKPCFLYLASFPEDYEISAKCLIRMWVEEGLIKREEHTTSEETAENYLEELFQRSIVQATSRSKDGLIKYCKVRDHLRYFAMHQAEQENFVTIFSKASDDNQSNRNIRRASFQSYVDPQLKEYVGPNTCTLLMFRCLPKLSNFRLLKVLYIVGIKSYNGELIGVLEKLIRLKFLAIRNCEISGVDSSCSLDHMKTLEILDIRGTELKLSNALWTIGTLRHVNCDGNSLNLPTLDGPISTTNLTVLETLKWVLPPRIWDKNLTLLNNLRKFGLCDFVANDYTLVTVTNLLATLSSLISLEIRGINLPMEIVYPKALPNYQNVQSLYLHGELPENMTLEARLFPPHLVKLKLCNSHLLQDPMPELGKLESLKKLCFGPDVIIYWGSLDCPMGFPVLRYLKVNDSCIQSIKVAPRAMTKLTYLEVSENIKLHLPRELQHLDRGKVQ